jgi:hypothetical protein
VQKLKSVHSISPQLSQIVEYWQLSDLYFAANHSLYICRDHLPVD